MNIYTITCVQDGQITTEVFTDKVKAEAHYEYATDNLEDDRDTVQMDSHTVTPPQAEPTRNPKLPNGQDHIGMYVAFKTLKDNSGNTEDIYLVLDNEVDAENLFKQWLKHDGVSCAGCGPITLATEPQWTNNAAAAWPVK